MLRRLLALSLLLSTFARAEPSPQEKAYADSQSGKSGKYMVRLPGGSSKGLLAFFHGSGNTATYAQNFGAVDQVAKELGLTPLVLQAPNGADTWANAARGPSNQHDVYARNLIDKEILAKNSGIDKKRIIFVGVSAGSTFLSGDFLPRFIGDYKGGAVLLCGGGGPVSQADELWRPLPRPVAESMPLSFYIQKQDFLWRQTRQGIAYWGSRGAIIATEMPEGGSHCGFDVFGEMKRQVKKILARG